MRQPQASIIDDNANATPIMTYDNHNVHGDHNGDNNNDNENEHDNGNHSDIPPTSIQRQRPRRPRNLARRTARVPLKIFQSLTLGVVRGGKKLVRKNRRRGGSNNDGRKSRRSRRRLDRHLFDDSMSTREENMPLISSPVGNTLRRSLSRRRSGGGSDDGNDALGLDLSDHDGMNHDEDDVGMGLDSHIQARVLNSAESILRQLLLLIVVYLLGVYQPVSSIAPDLVWNAGYLVGVAWGTCALIKLISWFGSASVRSDHSHLIRRQHDARGLHYRHLDLRESLDSDKEEEEFHHIHLNDEEDVDVLNDMEEVSKRLNRDLILDSYGSNEVLDLQRPAAKSPVRRQRVGSKVFRLKRRKPDNSKNAFDPEFGQDEKYNGDDESDQSEFAVSSHAPTSLPLIAGPGASQELTATDFKISPPKKTELNLKPPPQNHPELEDLHLTDLIDMERIETNGLPHAIENEFIKGEMQFMCRTSDADLKTKPDQTNGTPINDKRSQYFRSKKRRFEIQFQVKFKKIPPSQLYFNCELKRPLKLGVIQRAFVGATLNFVERKNNGAFTYNSPGKEPIPEDLREGKHEFPHLTFEVEKAFDRLVVTKEGDKLPVLGEEIYEDPEVLKSRQNGAPLEYNTRDTFTFSLWSAYVDFAKWKVVNLPAIRPFPLKSVILDQDFSMHVYYLEGHKGKARHTSCYQRRLLSFEMNHAKYSKLSEARKKLTERYNEEVENFAVRESLSLQEQFGRSTLSNDVDHLDAAVDHILLDSDSSDSEDGDEYSDSEIDHSAYDNDEETQALEELGEGMYLKSGDSIVLRDDTVSGNEVQSSSLTNGGGYATLQMEAAAAVIIEKVPPKSRKGDRINDQEIHKSGLIRNGDMVSIKLMDALGTHYLFVHKGWWLKWGKKAPRASGFFTIQTNDIEDINNETSTRRLGVETQSSYLRLGGSFQLRSGLSGLEVGVRVSNSAKFGGRVLGLYKSGSYYVTDHDPDATRIVDGINVTSKRQMMMPLKLRADLPLSPQTTIKDESPQPLVAFHKNIEDFRIDAPAWLEVMHRTKRQVVRVYAIRMTRQNNSVESRNNAAKISDLEEDQNSPFMRLRTGKDLTPLLRLGLASETESTYRTDSKLDMQEEKCFEDGECNAETKQREAYDLNGSMFEATNPNTQNDFEDMDSDSSDDNDDYISSENSRDEYDDEEQGIEPHTPRSHGYRETRKKKKWIKQTTHGISKVAKGVKTGTIKSGSLIGKAVTHTIKGNRRGYLKDKPRQTKGKAKSRDHHVAVNKALKKLQSPDRQSSGWSRLRMPNSIMAGQLKPPDQSCRTVSDVLSNVSLSPSMQAKMLLSAHLSALTDLDSSFLSGGAVELGVVADTAGKSSPIGEYIVARALWESHWREEACIIYDSCIDFYQPLSSKTCFSIPFYDIQRVRRVDSGSTGPLVGRPLLAIETAWKCHYLVLCTHEVLTDFFNILNASIFSHGEEVFQQDEWNAHMWQGVQSSADNSGDSAKWANIGSSSKKKQRIILNSRRMPFDCESFNYEGNKSASQREIGAFVQALLQRALCISLETLLNNPKSFIGFLDDVSRLRQLPWNEIDKSSSGAFCIVVNLYHCLLQHSLLLSKTGPPTKKNVVNFMRTHCYEIGGDVFSLAELEGCVIRGNMSKPYYPKSPYVEPHRSSRGHFAYALDYVDPRVNFVMNTGILSHPREITVLRPDKLEEELRQITELFLKNHIKVDISKKIVTLPKVCDVYRNDFEGTAKTCVEYCLKYLNESIQSKLSEILEKSPSLVSYKYEQSSDIFHNILKPKLLTGTSDSSIAAEMPRSN